MTSASSATPATEPTDHSSRASHGRPGSPCPVVSSASFEQSRALLNENDEAVDDLVSQGAAPQDQSGEYANGYHFPPKYPLKERIQMALVDFWDLYQTGFGFFFTMYALLVVGWGAMIFFLLIGAAPAMCWVNGKYDCNHIDSPRRIWIEIDSQVLTALFSLTAFGLAPWRIRDLYLLLRYRIKKDQKALRRLAGVHRAWLRLEGSEQLRPTLGPENIEEGTIPYDENSVPYPLDKIADAPPTGVRAPPTKLWKVDLMAWLNIFQIVFQALLSAFMWGMSRYNRPAWSVAVFLVLGFAVSTAAGIIEGIQKMRVKSIEGVKLTKRDLKRLARDKELGIPHYNNIKDKDPEKKRKKTEEKKPKREKPEV
ncbi:hypothetical protein F5Y17DRAFT_445090 [Xylariaceae sp. FL0594]|nr:hypothetical protein F5Y17DRAFT_445090 [Xylariaceae sp. FL0594]